MTWHISPKVAQHLGYYVYLYIDPRNSQVFYVGKGKKGRALSHLSKSGESRKVQILAELRELGLEPQIDILVHGLPDDETAYRVEAAVIDLLGLKNLTNQVRGWRSVTSGRKSLAELITYYAAPPAVITDPVMLIRINKRYRHGMSALELYEATRGVWNIAPDKHSEVKYALAVFESAVREVYEIQNWFPGGHTNYQTRPADEVDSPERWEFVGQVASKGVRARYLYHSVAAYIPKHTQNPVTYPKIGPA